VETDAVTRASFGVGLTVVLVLLLRLGERILSPKHLIAIDMRGKNVAYQVLHAGHVLAVLLLVPGVVKNCVTGTNLATNVIWAGAFGIAGLVLVQGVGNLGVRMLLRGTLQAELERGNVAAGVAAAANYVGIGIVASKAIAGSDLRGLGLAITFFGIALATLALFMTLFRALTTYDDAEQIQGENLAAALSYAGITIAIAIIVSHALEGDFEGWSTSLLGYARFAGAAVILYPVRQIVIQGLLLGRAPTLRGGALDVAIGVDRNRGAAVLEALTYVATAWTISELA
jgi:uncharacterized membrane protein YjfL (UPF0719 family)